METTLGEKTVYCCLTSGCLASDGTVWLTEVGRGTLEALLSLPVASEPVILRELQFGRIPLHHNILETAEAVPPRAGICFFGDRAGELDGVAFKALNVQARTSEVP